MLGFVWLSGCAGDPYRRATRADSIEGYRAFLRSSPEHEAVPEAREKLAELELVEAQRVHTVLAYKRFLKEFGETRAANTARALLATLHFEAASALDTADAYRSFLREHPGSAQDAEAKKRLAEAELRLLAENPQESSLRRLARENPEDGRVAQARSALDDAAFREALDAGPERLLAYLERFPTGEHRDEARAELERLELLALAHAGQAEVARERLGRSAYQSALRGLGEALERQVALERWISRDLQAQRATAAYYLRPKGDLVEALGAEDAKTRWEAARELGGYVSIDVIEPLLGQVRTARSLGVVRAAFESLRDVTALLPPKVARFELLRHERAWSERARDPDALRLLGVVNELANRPEAAVQLYASASRGADPDPFILWRMAELRAGQGRWLSSAIAARQIAVWGREIAGRAAASDALQGRGEEGILGLARQLCAAHETVMRAQQVIEDAKKKDATLEDALGDADHLAAEAGASLGARLRDAEVILHKRREGVRLCGEGTQQARLKAAEQERLRAVEQLARRAGSETRALMEQISQRDPSPEVRRTAAARLRASVGR